MCTGCVGLEQSWDVGLIDFLDMYNSEKTPVFTNVFKVHLRRARNSNNKVAVIRVMLPAESRVPDFLGCNLDLTVTGHRSVQDFLLLVLSNDRPASLGL